MTQRTRRLAETVLVLFAAACSDASGDGGTGAGGSMTASSGSTTSVTAASSGAGTGGSGGGGGGSGGSGTGGSSSGGGAGGAGGSSGASTSGSGGEGGAASTTGTTTSSGSGGEGGFGALCTSPTIAGSPVTPSEVPETPVPGCEVLRFVEEPLFIGLDTYGHRTRLAELDGGDVGLIYQEAQSTGTAAYRLETPFATWPPAFTGNGQFTLDVMEPTSSRREGLFAVSHEDGGAGQVRTYEGNLLFDFGSGRMVLDAAAGGGGFVFDEGEVRRYDALAPGAPSRVVGSLGHQCFPATHALGDGSLLAATQGPTDAGCIQSDRVDLVRVTPDGAVDLPPIDLGANYNSPSLVARPGGSWLVVRDFAAGPMCTIPLDEDGAVAGPSWRGFPDSQAYAFAPWRGGLAVVSLYPFNGIGVSVTDGVNVTRAAWPLNPPSSSSGRAISVVASDDGNSILVTMTNEPGMPGPTQNYLMRADCASE